MYISLHIINTYIANVPTQQNFLHCYNCVIKKIIWNAVKHYNPFIALKKSPYLAEVFTSIYSLFSLFPCFSSSSSPLHWACTPSLHSALQYSPITSVIYLGPSNSTPSLLALLSCCFSFYSRPSLYLLHSIKLLPLVFLPLSLWNPGSNHTHRR